MTPPTDDPVHPLCNSRDLVDASSDNRLAPGITAAFLLQGEAEVSLPRQRLQPVLAAGHQDQGMAPGGQAVCVDGANAG